MKSSTFLGVDIGGSHITSALVDVARKGILTNSFQRSGIDSYAGSDQIIESWSRTMLASLKNYPEPVKISIAMPGPFDYRKGISWMQGVNKYGQLYGLNIRELLLQRLSNQVSDIVFVNDASCFLQGEITCGAAVGFNKVAGFTLGTGFGSATSEDNVVRDGDFWQAPFLDKTCEEYFSTKWFVERYSSLYGGDLNNVKELTEPRDLGDPMLHIFDEFGLNIGLFLQRLHREAQYDCIVLGGNISNASMYYLPQVKAYLQANSIRTPIFISKLGEQAALIGAASYAYFNK